jgi:hypothetical protein
MMMPKQYVIFASVPNALVFAAPRNHCRVPHRNVAVNKTHNMDFSGQQIKNVIGMKNAGNKY